MVVPASLVVLALSSKEVWLASENMSIKYDITSRKQNQLTMIKQNRYAYGTGVVIHSNHESIQSWNSTIKARGLIIETR